MNEGAASEFSRLVPLARVGALPFRQEIAASDDEREALAGRFDLISLDRLVAQIELQARGRDMFLLHAMFEAQFTQSCVITLDPVAGAVAGEFELIYGPADAEETAAGLVDEAVAFEPLHGDAIDVGEAVAQEFSLSLPEFPRTPSADLAAEMPPGEPAAHPFGALAALRGRGEVDC
ncbi:MAG: DUF177 domain-containing protein [Alphaproteobacteria bacterium]|nr:DUF177 domain-containing protein [Alphaproteobacteria bacterium]